MPRLKRKVGLGTTLTPERKEAIPAPTWHYEEKLRFWCPVCGQMADFEHLEGSPWPVEAVWHRFGGRLPRTEWEKKTGAPAPGFMEYVPAPERRGELLKRLRAIAQALDAFLAKEESRPPRERGGREA